MSKLHDTRASDCLDLSDMVRRLGNASLEKGCWGQMIRKTPETGPRRWSAMTQWGERSASKGWNSSMLNKHTDLCLGDNSTLLNKWHCGQPQIHFRPENPCCAIMSTSHREQNIALVREENEPFSLAKCQREKKKRKLKDVGCFSPTGFCRIHFCVLLGFLKGYFRGSNNRGFV